MENRIRLPWLVSFLSSPLGRTVRAAAGVAMILGGIASVTPIGIVVAALGIIALGAGTLDICLMGPLFGGPFRGDEMRRRLHIQQGYYASPRSRGWAMA